MIVQPPIVQSPIVQSPIVQPPIVQSPIVQSPIVQSPIVQSPIVQSPIVQSMLRCLMRGIAMLAGLACCFAADLAQRMDALVAAPGGFAGIHVVEVATGKTVYARNEDRLLQPASNLKILTSALALERLGADYRFTTRVVREASGDVVLVGSGDPSLSGRVFPYRKDARQGSPFAAIEELAEQIAARGIQRIDGDIVGDDRLFPWDPYPPSWTQDDTIRDYGAAVSALTVNDNVVTVSIAPGARAGDPAVIALAPPLEYLTFDNRIVTAPRRGPASVRAQRVPASREWLLAGSIPAGHAALAEVIPVDDPALFAASALYDALTGRGIVIRGRPVARHRVIGDEYAAVLGEELASRTSPPLNQLLQMMDKVSQNLHAELLLREVGRSARGDGTHNGTPDGTPDGTTQAGLAALRAYLLETGATPGDWRLEDGSGLSRNALVTPRLLTHVLTRMAQSKDKEIWLSLLPAGGEDGTLSSRLCCLTDGRGIRAKTGSLSRALALSGYADSATRGPLAFSILVNDFSAPPAAVRQWIDKIATALLE
jgi:D-alanyl-D-alanine carboxypeptidase/D-alanyl-D-alanine-endopeptidase (penicillin-binding protein 4)